MHARRLCCTAPGGLRQAIEGLLHQDCGEAAGALSARGPLLAKSTMDTRAQRDESDEWRDWCVRVCVLVFLRPPLAPFILLLACVCGAKT